MNNGRMRIYEIEITTYSGARKIGGKFTSWQDALDALESILKTGFYRAGCMLFH